MNAWKIITAFLIVAVLILGWALFSLYQDVRAENPDAGNSVLDSVLPEPEKERSSYDPVDPDEHYPDSNGLLWWRVNFVGGATNRGFTVYPTAADQPMEGMGGTKEELQRLRQWMRDDGRPVTTILPINAADSKPPEGP